MRESSIYIWQGFGLSQSKKLVLRSLIAYFTSLKIPIIIMKIALNCLVIRQLRKTELKFYFLAKFKGNYIEGFYFKIGMNQT